MNLVVFAHPLPDSLCARVLERIVSGRDAVVADLYRDGFSPVLTPADAKAYGAPPEDALVARYRRELAAARTLTFVFPVWMYGMPAILKGYFDRVWVPEVSFSLKSGTPVGLLTALRKVSVACTFGQPQAFYEQSSDPVALFFRQLMSQNCAAGCAFDYAPLFGLDGRDEAAVADYLGRVGPLID